MLFPIFGLSATTELLLQKIVICTKFHAYMGIVSYKRNASSLSVSSWPQIAFLKSGVLTCKTLHFWIIRVQRHCNSKKYTCMLPTHINLLIFYFRTFKCTFLRIQVIYISTKLTLLRVQQCFVHSSCKFVSIARVNQERIITISFCYFFHEGCFFFTTLDLCIEEEVK